MFPKDIWFLVFLHTSPADWIRFSRVCKDFYKWIITDSDARLWSKMGLKEHMWCFEDASTDFEIYKKIGELSKQLSNSTKHFIINLLFPFKNIYNDLYVKYKYYDGVNFVANIYWKNEHALFVLCGTYTDESEYHIWNKYITDFINNDRMQFIFDELLSGNYNFKYPLLLNFEYDTDTYDYNYFKELNESFESAEPTTKRIKK